MMLEIFSRVLSEGQKVDISLLSQAALHIVKMHIYLQKTRINIQRWKKGRALEVVYPKKQNTKEKKKKVTDCTNPEEKLKICVNSTKDEGGKKKAGSKPRRYQPSINPANPQSFRKGKKVMLTIFRFRPRVKAVKRRHALESYG